MPSALFITTVPVTLEVFLAPFARHFRSEGWRVDALANGAASEERIASSFDQRFDVSWSRDPLSPHNLLGTSARIREIVEAGGYDIVHVHTPIAAFVTRWALRRRPVGSAPRVIYTAHGFHFYEGQRLLPHALFRTIERVAAPWTDYLVTINDEDFEAARRFRGIAADRVRLIPGIGVDLDAYRFPAEGARERIRAELAIPHDAFVLTMIAEFGPVKRHGFLLEALSKIDDPRIIAVLVGEGPLLEQTRERARILGLAERVRFAGYRRDVPEVLAASDAVTLVSEREGLARSLLEAMAAGKALIGTKTRGIADLITPDTGWLVGKNDVGALANAIAEAAASLDEVARRGAGARARAEERYSLPAIIEQYERLYAEALA